MRRVDLLEHADTAEITEILRRSSEATEPAQMLATLGPWLRRMRRSDFFLSVSKRGLADGQYKITRVIDNPDQVGMSPTAANPWRDWTKITSHEGGIVGEIIARDHPQLIREIDITDDPVLGITIRDMRSALAIPNFDDGEAINWAIFFKADPAGWDPDEVPAVMQDMNMLGMATKNLVEKRRAEELNRRYLGQLEQVAQVQRALLPARVPNTPGVEIATSYLTSDEAGGDFYHFYRLADGSLSVLIADVAGHGPAAATVMAMLRAILLCYEHETFKPQDVMAFCNAKLVAACLSGSFTTAFLAVIDPATGRLCYSRWGHNPPRLRRASGAIESLAGAAALPLGVDAGEPGRCEEIALWPGDTVVLYTDGITEAFNPPAAHGEREQFGVGRLDRALAECSGRPECVIDSVHGALFSHTGSMTRDDDQTLVAVQYMGTGNG